MKAMLVALFLCRILYANYLDNGFEYQIEKKEILGERISVTLTVKVGFLHETENETGIAHFVEHIVFRENEIETLGVELPEHVNALTGMDATIFSMTIPRENLERALDILSEVAARAVFDGEVIERERIIVMKEIREKLTDLQLKRLKTLAEMLLGEKIWRFPPGNPKVIETCTRETLLKFYHRWYRPDRMVLAIQGNVDEQEAKEYVAKYFGTFVNRNKCFVLEEREYPFAKREPVIIRSNDGLPMISIAGLSPYCKGAYDFKRIKEMYEEGAFLSFWCIQFRLTEEHNFFECGAILLDKEDEANFLKGIWPVYKTADLKHFRLED